MALSFIGKPISLISHSDVRYRGILAGIDPAASTIQLSNVYSMGTESRRPADQFIPPVQEPYAYIIFRASEVKDLAVDEPQPRRSVHDDPAVIGVSAPVAQGNYAYGSPGYQQPPGGVQPPQAPASASPHQARQQAYPTGAPAAPNAPAQQQSPAPGQNGATPPAGQAGPAKTTQSSAVRAATASLESVQHALDDLRVSGQDATTSAPSHHARGGRRGGNRHDTKTSDLKVPTTDFDFQSANARFDKSALGPNNRATPQSPEATPDDEDDADDSENKEKKEKSSAPSAYNPKSSFFDSLSSGSNGPTPEGVRGGRGGRRGGGGRNRREEERERNVATFGEPGGIGLMGPGAYVGGWGGYGRRGGGRGGRRGGGPGPSSRQ